MVRAVREELCLGLIIMLRGVWVARSPLVQHKAEATASWVAASGATTVSGAAAAVGAAQVRLLPSPFASADMPGRLPTTTDSSLSPSTSSGRFGRMRTLSAPERRTVVATVEAARPQASPTKSGASGSPGKAGLLSAQAAWAALGGSNSPQCHSAVNSPREAFQRWRFMPASCACFFCRQCAGP